MRVVFWGTPAFAVRVLEAVAASRHELAGVVTQPGRPSGRGRRIEPSPVARRAGRAGVPVLQPQKPRGAPFRDELSRLAADVFLVAAYGAILPESILDMPGHGSLNVHASLLPAYRGAAPVTRAILDGKVTTGITIMRMDAGLDTGPILMQEEIPIRADDTAGTLTERLAGVGGRLAVQALDRLAEGRLEARPQDDRSASHAPKVSASEARIDWSRPAVEIERAVRAFDPWPGAWTSWRGERLKVFRLSPARAHEVGEAAQGARAHGTLAVTPAGPIVRAGDGWLAIQSIQPAGGRRMGGAEWARGRGLASGEILGGEDS